MPHKFDPGEAARLLREERYTWQPPHLVIDALGLRPDEVFVDIGCGPGYFTLPAARAVSDRGKVYAVDISLDMLMHMGQRLYAEGLFNVEKILSRESNIPLPDECADAALLANVLHEAEEPLALLREVRRLLRKEGRLLIVDWRREESPVGPPLEDRLESRAVIDVAFKAGLVFSAEVEVGTYHWGLLFNRGAD